MPTKAQIMAINKLLSDIYRKPMRVSNLLVSRYFSEEKIQLIANQFLTKAIANFLSSLQETMTDFHDGARLYNILYQVYGNWSPVYP